MARLGILAVCLFIVQISAIPWEEASSTSTVKPTTSWHVSPTSKPSLSKVTSFDGNHTYESPHICGWIDHNSDNSYTCGGSATCLWDSSLKLVGCGHATSVNYFTSCVPYRNLDKCDTACFANPSIIRCGSDIPYCVTPRVGPKGNYSIFGCQANRPYGTSHVNLIYEGQTTVGHLPRYLGADGIITYGTRTPSVPSSTIVRTTSGSRSFSSLDLHVATILITSTYRRPIASACADEKPHRHRHSDMSVIPEASVVAGIIVGGIVLLGAIAGLFVWLIYRTRGRAPVAQVASDLQADLDMMPLEELEGGQSDNKHRSIPSSSLEGAAAK